MIERYATPAAWAEYFTKNEDIRISYVPIKDRLEKAGIIGRIARGKAGNVLNSLCSERDVRQLCADLLSPLLVADKSGCIIEKNIRYGTFRALARMLGLSPSKITSSIESIGLSPMLGKDANGHIQKFYPELAVREVCADLIAPMPIADKSGFVVVGGVRHVTISAISHLLGICHKSIAYRLHRFGVAPVHGKTSDGNLNDFYSEPRIREVCADLLAPMPQSDANGFVIIDGVRHATILALVRLLGISQKTIESRFRASGLVASRGKTYHGKICSFYPEPAVRELCRDLIERKKSNPKPR
jgi:hypothetical protein